MVEQVFLRYTTCQRDRGLLGVAPLSTLVRLRVLSWHLVLTLVRLRILSGQDAPTLAHPRLVFTCKLDIRADDLIQASTYFQHSAGCYRLAGPPNHHDDKVVSDQQVVNKELSLCYRMQFGRAIRNAGIRLRLELGRPP